MAESVVLRSADRPVDDLVHRLAQTVRRCRDWRRNGLALLLGLAAAAAMPPFNLVPMLVPAFTGLIWLIDGAVTRRRAFFDGWLWGMGFLVPSLYWICLSMTGDLAQFWWMIPITILGLPAYLSLYGGTATLLTRAFGNGRTGIGRVLIFAALWAGAEWLRGHIPFGGFPWVLIGYAWSGDSSILLDMLQSTSVIGIYGLTLVTVLIASLPACIGDAASPRRRVAPMIAGALLAAVLAGWGAARLAQGPDADVPGVTLRLVQTDVPNGLEETIDDRIARLRTVLATADRPGASAVTAQIWPESSVDFLLNLEPSIRTRLGESAPADGVILTGTLLSDPGAGQIWNSIAVVDRQGIVTDHYNKAHLVPFGEYVPLYDLLKFVPLVAGRQGLSIGPGAVTLDLPHLPPVSPTICYEGIFAHAAIDQEHRPGWILNVTNDAWFGRSTGPSQHFAQARVRAVEDGLPLVRAANGGISGVVDAHGRRVETLPLGTTGILDVKLPVGLTEPTLYGRFGDGFVLLMALAACAVGLVTRRRVR